VSKLIAKVQLPDGLGALIEVGFADREPKDQAGIGYVQGNCEELYINWMIRVSF